MPCPKSVTPVGVNNTNLSQPPIPTIAATPRERPPGPIIELSISEESDDAMGITEADLYGSDYEDGGNIAPAAPTQHTNVKEQISEAPLEQHQENTHTLSCSIRGICLVTKISITSSAKSR